MRILAPLTLALLAAVSPVISAGAAWAGETHVAVAANFTEAAREIATAFEKSTGHTAVLSFGSTGQLYTQITQQAPFEVFLSADDKRPTKAVEEGLGVEGTVFTYAVGRLVLWSAKPDMVKGPETLAGGDFEKIALANPKTAPYGLAATEVMAALKVDAALAPKQVQGNNISQTFQYISSGAAELGFVALSQLAGREDGSRWLVPEKLHSSLRQDAVLLKTGADDAASKAFMSFLKGPEAAKVIAKYGYGTAAGS